MSKFSNVTTIFIISVVLPIATFFLHRSRHVHTTKLHTSFDLFLYCYWQCIKARIVDTTLSHVCNTVSSFKNLWLYIHWCWYILYRTTVCHMINTISLFQYLRLSIDVARYITNRSTLFELCYITTILYVVKVCPVVTILSYKWVIVELTTIFHVATTFIARFAIFHRNRATFFEIGTICISTRTFSFYITCAIPVHTGRIRVATFFSITSTKLIYRVITWIHCKLLCRHITYRTIAHILNTLIACKVSRVTKSFPTSIAGRILVHQTRILWHTVHVTIVFISWCTWIRRKVPLTSCRCTTFSHMRKSSKEVLFSRILFVKLFFSFNSSHFHELMCHYIFIFILLLIFL